MGRVYANSHHSLPCVNGHKGILFFTTNKKHFSFINTTKSTIYTHHIFTTWPGPAIGMSSEQNTWSSFWEDVIVTSFSICTLTSERIDPPVMSTCVSSVHVWSSTTWVLTRLRPVAPALVCTPHCSNNKWELKPLALIPWVKLTFLKRTWALSQPPCG